LYTTEEEVTKMQQKLEKLQPILMQKNQENAAMLITLQAKQKEVIIV
jgi:hypothetical protein